MNIPIILNDEEIILQSSADTSLLTVLRKQKLLQAKRGCEKGSCGACMVLMNGIPVPACKIPVALAQNKRIVTLEYFSKSEMYVNIMRGFTKAGIKLCGFCNSGKIFTTALILASGSRPTRASIFEQIKNLSPCCTDSDTLINGIIYAFELHVKKDKTN